VAVKHNNAHGRGLQHDDKGNWYNPQTRAKKVIAVAANPETEQTPQQVVDMMLSVINPNEDDVVFDLGCGDGRIVIAAAQKYGCRAVGIEINPVIAAQATRNVIEAELTDRVLIRTGDATEEPLIAAADIVVMYLYPGTVKEIVPKLSRAHTIVSISHLDQSRVAKVFTANAIHV
jgi:precorrin-6B methylase 2